MAAVVNLVSLAQIKAWLGIDTLVTTYDSRLNIMIAGFSKKVVEFTGDDFQKTIVGPPGEIMDGTRSDFLVPRGLPIISVEHIELHVDVTGLGGLDLDPDEYQAQPGGIQLKRLNSPQGRSNVLIQYTYGYETVPEDVQMAMLLAVEAGYLRQTGKRIGISSRSKTVGPGVSESENYLRAWDEDSGLPKEAIALLQSYKTFEWPSIPMPARNY